MYSELYNTEVNLIPNLFSLLLFSLQIPPQVGFLTRLEVCMPSIHHTHKALKLIWHYIKILGFWVIAGQSRCLCQGLYFLLYACAIWELIEFYLSSVLLFSVLFRTEERGERAAGANVGLQRDYCLLIYSQLNCSVVIFPASIPPPIQLWKGKRGNQSWLFQLFWLLKWWNNYTINSYSALSEEHSKHKSALYFIHTVVYENRTFPWFLMKQFIK